MFFNPVTRPTDKCICLHLAGELRGLILPYIQHSITLVPILKGQNFLQKFAKNFENQIEMSFVYMDALPVLPEL